MLLTGIDTFISVILLSTIVWFPTTINTRFMYADLLAIAILGIVHSVLSAIKSKFTYNLRNYNPNTSDSSDYEVEPLTEEEKLVNEYINTLIEYCLHKGYNTTLHGNRNQLWLVKVDDYTGEFTNILNLSDADSGKLTRQNLQGYLLAAEKFIDEKINSLSQGRGIGGNNE